MATPQLKDYWSRPQSEVLTALETSFDGLPAAAVKRRLKTYGPNQLLIRSSDSSVRILVRQFTNPLVLILFFAVVVSLIVGELVDAAVVSVMVVATALITFVQENSARKAVAKLRKRLVHRVTVRRDGEPTVVNAETVVPGDVVMLSAGSLIPADGVVVECRDLFVNQAVLTGETFPVEKALEAASELATLSERTNCVFMGTSVRSGYGSFVVTRTGLETEFGKIAESLAARVPETDFQRGIRQFGTLLARIMILLVVLAFTANILFERPPVDSLLFAIALAVGLSPELLPAIITITLSKGARKMAKAGVIVRRLESIENLGSMDVLCTDKTGTLTEGVIRLDGAVDPAGNPSRRVDQLAFFNASLQSGLSNPLDEAITAGRGEDALSGVQKVGEIPYDFDRKRLGVVARDPDGASTLIVKGALDSVLAVCSHVREHEESAELTESLRASIIARLQEWGERGFRVLGVASKAIAEGTAVERADETELTFEGNLLFLDPPKKGAADAVASLKRLNVELKIITGDNRYVAGHLAESIRLPVRSVLTGREIDRMSTDALLHRVDNADLFVEVDPMQKERIIQALRKRGHVVGYLGDGINDAPALKDADVGISVDGAVDVAREAADLVLLKKGLGVLCDGIVEGRKTFANSLKYVFTTTSANFGNMFSMAAASFFLPFLPLLAKQVLLNNFLSDVPAIAIAGDNVDHEYIEQPPKWDMKFIRDFMLLFGTVSSVFDFVTFGVLLYIFRAAEAEFRTGWFIESLLTELLVALAVRTRRPFFRSIPGSGLWISTVAVALVALGLPYTDLAALFNFTPLPPALLAFILAISAAYFGTTEVLKAFFFRRLARS